jgi:hypothetical protein
MLHSSPESHTLKRKTDPSTLRIFFLAVVFLVALSSTARAQQTYVTRYDAYAGYGFLGSPSIGLNEHGFALQAGFRPKTWLSFGFDYTRATGDLDITPDLLPSALQQQLGAQLAQLAAAGRLPPGYTLVVPAHSTTQTFAVGPQLAYRHFTRLTLFLRPVFAGAIHEVVTPRPRDPIAAAIVSQLTPSGKKTDTAPFAGFGGGIDVIFTKHFSLRVQSDLVYDHLFNDLLRNGRFTARVSVGPAFNFGRNIVK